GPKGREGGGGQGGYFGEADGGGLGIYGGIVTVTNSVFAHNQAIGGDHNTGSSGDLLTGGGQGGGIANYATLTADNLTLRDNQAIGGNGNRGGIFAGDGIGGGLLNRSGGPGTRPIPHNTTPH